MGKAVIDYGMKYLNKPYRYAGKGPKAFDCSGFTSFVFREFGYKLSSSSNRQDRQVPTIRRKEDLRPGDLVFFEGRSPKGKVEHVGIVCDVFPNAEFTFLHASVNRGVVVSHSTEPYYASRYLRGGRVLRDNDRAFVLKDRPSEIPKGVAVNDNKKNAFITPAKAKEMRPVRSSSVWMQKETESLDLQKKDAAVPEKARTDTVIIRSRPAPIPLSDTTRDEKEIKDVQKGIMVPPDTVKVPKPVKKFSSKGKSVVHEVKSGETLYSISRRYSCTVEQIREWNPRIGSLLKAGEKLILFP